MALDGIDEKLVTDLKEIFDLFDQDKDGQITAAELGDVMRALGQNPTEPELQTIIDEADLDNNGALEFSDFVRLMSDKVKPISLDEELWQVFVMLDRNGDGRVSKEELREAMAVLANGVSEADLNEMLQAADEDDDGHISYEEFVKVMKTN
ncbi:unnamed protein product [Clonostachys rhizophaga]|uniref:Calmodulin n=1 Tax=Clonostachys rhizophaga TaxID=160324 RepID=A0A9N9V6A1_9HYPO|nr:unnamed protein product [Clonostachys rhizophaga]